MKSFDDSWEKNIFGQGGHLNKYPFGELVSYVFRLYKKDLNAGKKPKVLEIGFGPGANLAFFAREGFETYGIEGSASACKAAKELLASQNLKAEIVNGDFVSLPFQDNTFDLILDREAVYCNKKEAILKIAQEVKRCLVPGGRFLTFTYSTDHGSFSQDQGEQVEPNTFTNFKSGPFTGTGVTHFFTEEEIKTEYLKDFKIEFMHAHRCDIRIPQQRNLYAEYITCAQKVPATF